MRRINPVGTFVGFFLTILMVIGLGISLWVNRGLAFSPGPITEISRNGVEIQGFKSHADFEERCVYCHEPIKYNLATKCIICHTEVSEQMQSGEGVHSQINIDDCVSSSRARGRRF
jgi:hypothetical protein